MSRFKVLVTGTGRCGTGYMSQTLTQAGLECGHERFFGPLGLDKAVELSDHWLGTQAESSWMIAPYLGEPLTEGATVIHLRRSPQKTIESLLKINFWDLGEYVDFVKWHTPEVLGYRDELDRTVAFVLAWSQMITHPDIIHRVEDDPIPLLKELGLDTRDPFNGTSFNSKGGYPVSVGLEDIQDPILRDQISQLARSWGYEFPTQPQPIRVVDRVTKAVITTLDNLPTLKEQIDILGQEGLDEIVVVNNGSQDGTREWLETQAQVTVVNRENRGAGPGRNSGLDKAGEFDYVLMLDGGIRPLRGGIPHMRNYLEYHPEGDVVGVEIPDFETDYQKAWRRWPRPITKVYQNTRLSHTAYCMTTQKAWDGIRFCEDGPFGEPGWGGDDDELAYQWKDAGIIVHVVTGIHPYRRGSGSFARLYEETGVWPNQYGSVYEKRVVWLQQRYPGHEPGIQWGRPWLTLSLVTDDLGVAEQGIITAHTLLRDRGFASPWDNYPNPYAIVLCTQDPKIMEWGEDRALRQFHGDTLIIDGNIIKHTPGTEAKDFQVMGSWEPGPDTHYYGVARSVEEVVKIVSGYGELYPRQPVKIPPEVWGQEVNGG